MEQKQEKQKQEARRARQMLVVLLAFGVVLASASLLLRSLTNGLYEVQSIDLILLIIPLLVVALATGKLRSLDLFGVKVDFADLWSEAGREEIKDQVSDPTLIDAVDVLGMAIKGSLQELRNVIGERRTGRQIEALQFKLGHSRYTAEVIAKYFKALSASLRVVVVNDPEGKLFAIYNAPDLISSLRSTEPQGYQTLEHILNGGHDAEWSELADLPGFVSADTAVTESTSKRDALAMMENLNTDILPVVNEERQFIGIVERSKLTAGLILAVTNKLEDR